MNAQRARAHARVTRTVRDLGPAKLQPAEQARIRLAADTLLFCADPGADAAARAAQDDMAALCLHLSASGRWEPARAMLLLEDLWDCGPASGPLTAAA